MPSAAVLAADRPLEELRMHVARLTVRAFAAKNRPAESIVWSESDVRARRPS
jgi:hypothetical protein